MAFCIARGVKVGSGKYRVGSAGTGAVTRPPSAGAYIAVATARAAAAGSCMKTTGTHIPRAGTYITIAGN